MPTTAKSDKTVYIIGAGFSAPAGGPNQSLLLKKIFELSDSNEKTRECQNALKQFLINTLCVAPDKLSDVSLEDIYTPIDRCLADGVSLRNMPPSELQVLSGQIEYLISLAIDRSFESQPIGTSQYVHDFSKYLVNQASIRATKAENTASADAAKKYDPFSIISLNWDILLDKGLHKQLAEHDNSKINEQGDYSPIGVVDYCCYISSIERGEKRIRSGLWVLGSRGYNVKLLKIHGSMNWLQCSSCQRLFTSFDEKINIPNYIDAKQCRHCEKYDIDAKLQGSLVMPTFLKDLSNFQIKLVWQNAGVELMEATKLVFIGYSLPQADFEFRQLLSRMVHKNANIHVVLYKTNSAKGRRQYTEERKRYKQFFSGRKITFQPGGVVKFVTELTRPGRS